MIKSIRIKWSMTVAIAIKLEFCPDKQAEQDGTPARLAPHASSAWATQIRAI
jgi:hypothetical protein